jgi:photosystem II stability/assembly factor-like uncharacterized protein
VNRSTCPAVTSRVACRARRTAEKKGVPVPPEHVGHGALGAVAVASPMVWWIADPARGTIQITTDAGKTWQTRPSSASGAASSLEALDANRAWLVVTDAHDIGVLYATSDGGRTWTKVTWKSAA